MNPKGSFDNKPAPCGRLSSGESYEDRDDEVVVTQETLYSCGCQMIQHEYHDGTVSHWVVRHDGHVLVDELLTAT